MATTFGWLERPRPSEPPIIDLGAFADELALIKSAVDANTAPYEELCALQAQHNADPFELIELSTQVKGLDLERNPGDDLYAELFDCKGEQLARRVQALLQLWLRAVSEKRALDESHDCRKLSPYERVAGHRAHWLDHALNRVLKRKLPADAGLIELELRLCKSGMTRHLLPSLIDQIQRHISTEPLPEHWRRAVVNLRKEMSDHKWFTQEDQRILRAADELLGRASELPLKAGQAWADAALREIEAMPATQRSAWQELLAYAAEANPSKASAAWLKKAKQRIDAIGEAGVLAAVQCWLPLFATDTVTYEQIYGIEYNDIDRPNRAVMLGLIWIAAEIGTVETVRLLARTGERIYKQKLTYWHPVGHACIRALPHMNHPEALAELSQLELRLRKPALRKVVVKALEEAAKRQEVSPEELAECTVPDFGLRDGVVRREIDETMAELTVPQRGKPAVRWITGDKSSRVAPKAVREQHPDAVAEMKQLGTDIEKALDAQRHRLDRLMRDVRTWPLEQWRELYLDHPLMSLLTRRLIWNIGDEPAIWHDGAMLSRDGQTVAMRSGASVTLWHPLHQPAADVLAWRGHLESLDITQPIKQAHREIYVLTDAELRTEVYSNRFAAHVLRNMLMIKLCQARGWKSGLYGGETGPRLLMPAFGVQAEFWVNVANIDDVNPYGMPTYVATDQLRFHPLGNQGGKPTVEPEAAPLERVPALALSEAMRDVDLFVGVCSVGNDPAWQDGGPEGRYRDYWHTYSFGDLSATAETRKAVLERLVPRLKIAERCRVDGRFLIVRGDVRTYKIHLGSGNILMEPNDQYLCIVPGPRNGGGDVSGGGKTYLPFEGDQTLSIILSKAFMLAEDRKITDGTITSQIGRG